MKFKTTKDIEDYIRSNGDKFARKMLNCYNVFVDICNPITIEQQEDIMWTVLEVYDAI